MPVDHSEYSRVLQINQIVQGGERGATAVVLEAGVLLSSVLLSFLVYTV